MQNTPESGSGYGSGSETLVLTYEVKSKSNATDEIKQKLLLVHKNVFSRNFAHIYCRSEPTFQLAPTTAVSRRRTGPWYQNAWPHPRSSSSPPWSPCGQTAAVFLLEVGNRLPVTDQTKKGHFQVSGSRRRPSKCALRRRSGQLIWSLSANFFTSPGFSCKMLKIVLTEPDGPVHKLSQWPGILPNALTATVATGSWIVSIFLKISGGPDHQCFYQP